MKTIDPREIERLVELSEKATPGKWASGCPCWKKQEGSDWTVAHPGDHQFAMALVNFFRAHHAELAQLVEPVRQTSAESYKTERNELSRAKLHGPDTRTIDALHFALDSVDAAERDFIQVHHNCIRARDELAQAQRDAERYRWMREHYHSDGYDLYRLVWYLPRNVPLNGEGLDTTLDAAIDAKLRGGES